MGLAEQTGKSRTENKHGTVIQRDASMGLNGDGRTCVEGTAEVGAAVALAPAGAPGLSSGSIVTALTPHTQLSVAALLIHRTRLPEETQQLRVFFFLFSKESAGG